MTSQHVFPAIGGGGRPRSENTINAVELEVRSTLLRGLEQWLAASGMTQTEAAKILKVTQARVSDIKRGKINQFSLDLLIRLAVRAGLQPKIRIAA